MLTPWTLRLLMIYLQKEPEFPQLTRFNHTRPEEDHERPAVSIVALQMLLFYFFYLLFSAPNILIVPCTPCISI